MKKFKVKQVTRLSHNTVSLSLSPKHNWDRFNFTPGQYAAIGFKNNGRPSPVRCFSLASSPNQNNQLEFGMRVYGDFTHSVSNLVTGDDVFLEGPFGNFVLEPGFDNNVILMAGGIGITPFMSMIRYNTERRTDIRITLLYSCPSEDNVPFYEELLRLEKANPHFNLILLITDGSISKFKDNRVLSGRLNEARLSSLTDGRYNNFTYFICGPKTFTSTMVSILDSHDTEADRIMTEEFTPSSKANSESSVPGHSLSKWTYALSGITMILAISFIMIIDLARAVPKLVNAQGTTKSTNQSTNTPQTTGSSTGSSTASTPSNSSTSTTTNNSSYSSPVTSVS